jgi:DNA-binding MarR family transcriptional regulator
VNDGLLALRQSGDFETALSHDDKLELKVWLRLLTCTAMIDRRVRNRLRQRFEITLPRFDLLAQLDRAKGGLTMSELSNRLMVSNGNVTGLTERLVQEGLVRRDVSPRDRRTQRVQLTAAGKRAFDAMTPEHEAWIDELFAGLDREELAMLQRLLGKLKLSLKPDATSQA